MSTRSSASVIDFGGHVQPLEVAPEFAQQLNTFVGSHHTDVPELAQWYEDTGVDAAALSQPFFMGHADAEWTAQANDVLLEEINDYDQFYGLAAIPTAAGGEAAASEFERALANGYHGGAIETKSNGIELVDQAVEPIFEVANEANVPLLVHPTLDDSVHPEALDEKYLLNAIFGREVALCESISKVIHSDILNRYPDLTLVYHHFGGNIASMLGRIHVQLDPGRWPGQEHVVDFDTFVDTLTDRVFIDTSGFFGYESPLRTALDVFPASQILFGTDTPYEPRAPDEVDQMIATVEDIASGHERDRILGENAQNLLE